MNKTKTNTMQLNKQRLQLWLDGKVAAYNNGSSQDIEMIQRLCEHTNEGLLPIGGGLYYTCIGGRWVGSYACEKIPHHPVSWFFEQEGPRYEVKSWVCDCGIWDNWNKTFVGRPIESEKIALEILKWYQSID